jgi:hypothetical protein
MKTTKKIMKTALLILVCGVLALGNISVAYAVDYTTVGHSCTVSVPDSLSITADTTDITLTFTTYDAGSETNQKSVVYTVVANNMRQADGQAAINVNLDSPFSGVDLKAKVGAYTKVAGNTSLAAANADFVTIGTDNVGVANKASSTGDGKILNGTIPITYKGVATADLPTGNETHLLFVTLTTI